MNKSWCVDHFSCYLCDEKMNQKLVNTNQFKEDQFNLVELF